MSQAIPASTPDFRGKLARKMLTVLIPISLVPLLIMGGIAYVRSRQILVNQIENTLVSIEKHQRSEIDIWIEARKERVNEFYFDPTIVEAFQTVNQLSNSENPRFNAARELILTSLEEINATEDLIHQFFVISSDGKILVASNQHYEGTQLIDTPYFEQLSTEHALLAVYKPEPIYHSLAIIAARPYYTIDGEHLVTIWGLTGFSHFEALFNDFSFLGIRNYIITEDGSYVGMGSNIKEDTDGPVFQPSAEQTQLFASKQYDTSSNVVEFTSFDGQEVMAAYMPIPELKADLVIEIPTTNIIQQLQNLPYFGVLLAFTILISGLLTWVGTRRIVRPILEVVASAEHFSEGDWQKRALVNSDDEIGLLAYSFNQMADELSTLYRTLETQIITRTQQVRTTSEITQIATSATDLDTLLQQAIRLIVERFGYYYAAIYLLDEAKENAVLKDAFSVIEGGQMQLGSQRLPVGEGSIIGQVSATNQFYVAADVSEDPYYLPVSDLPDTRSEVVIPLSVGDNVIGVLDVQSHRVNAFEADSIATLQTLANQIATVLQNFHLLEFARVDLRATSALYQASHTIAEAETSIDVLQALVATLGQTPFISALFQVEEDSLISLSMADPVRGVDIPQTASTIPISAHEMAEIFENTALVIGTESDPTENFPSKLLDVPRKLGCQSFAFLPIMPNKQLEALLVLGAVDITRLTRIALEPYISLAEITRTALEKVDALERIQQRLVELETISKVGQTISTEIDLNSLYDVIYRQITRVMGDVVFLIAAYHAEKNMIEVPYLVEEGEVNSIDPFPFGQGLSSIVIRTQQPLMLVEDTANRSQALGAVVTESGFPKSWLGVPLMVANQCIGAIAVQDLEHEHRFGDDDIRLLGTLASQVAIAIRNARLFEQIRTRSTQLQTAAEISRAASSILEPNPLLLQAVNLIRDRFDLYYAGIFIIDEDGSLTGETGRWAVLRAGSGEAGRIQVEQGHKLEIGEESMIGQCIVSSQARISQTIPEEFQRYANPHLPDTQSEIALPLISRGKVIGAMTIQSVEPEAFSEQAISVFQTMSDQVANALQNAYLFDQIQQNAAELSILNEMSLALSRQLDIDEIIQTIHQYTSQLMDTTYFFIALYDADEEMISFPLVIENNEFSQIPTMHKRRGLTQHVIDSREPLLIDENIEEAIKDLGLEEIIVGEPTKSWLGVPLLIGGKVLGVIAAQSATKPRMFNTHHQDLLILVAQQSAIALQNAQLFAQTQKQLADISTIQETTADLSAALTLDGVINTLLAHMALAVSADAVSIFSIDGTRLTRVGIYPPGESSPLMGKVISLADYPLTQQVIDTQKPLAVSGDDERLQKHAQDAFKVAGVAANATIPIVGPEGVLGTVSVSRNHPAANFSESELALMETLANQAAVAILNARSYERVQEVAEEMSMLFDISQELTAAPLGIIELANVIARNFLDVLSFPECSISIFNPEENTLETVIDLHAYESEIVISDEHIGTEYTLNNYPATARVIKTLQPTVVHASDSNADPAELAYMKETETTTLVILPLAVKGHAIGIVELESEAEEIHYTQSELNLAMTLANQAAVALDNARLYEEQIEITEQLRELDKLKSQFLANMSHELRTPLNSIIGFSRVIMKGIDGPVTEQQTQDLSAIYTAGQHLLNMINDILDLSKIEAGKMELAFEDVDLTQIIESVMSTARGLIKEKPVELRTDIPKELPVIHADPTRVRQILLNLLSNAAKFTDEGHITITAQKQTGASGRPEIQIAVTDTGIGIALEDQQNLFEPFTQVDGSATRKTGGTGLGLSITRLLVNLHDGQIGIDSKPGAGSTFSFTLPVAQDGEIPDDESVKESDSLLQNGSN